MLRQAATAVMVGVAQLAERQVVVLDVTGSNPVVHPSITAGQGADRRDGRPVWCPQCPIWGRTVRFWEPPSGGRGSRRCVRRSSPGECRPVTTPRGRSPLDVRLGGHCSAHFSPSPLFLAIRAGAARGAVRWPFTATPGGTNQLVRMQHLTPLGGRGRPSRPRSGL